MVEQRPINVRIPRDLFERAKKRAYTKDGLRRSRRHAGLPGRLWSTASTSQVIAEALKLGLDELDVWLATSEP